MNQMMAQPQQPQTVSGWQNMPTSQNAMINPQAMAGMQGMMGGSPTAQQVLNSQSPYGGLSVADIPTLNVQGAPSKLPLVESGAMLAAVL